MSGGMQRVRLAGLAALVAVGALAAAVPSAFGAVVTQGSNGNIAYAAGGGESNHLTLTADAVNNVFTDSAGVTPGAGCLDDPAADPNVALCPRGGTSLITIDVGDLDDEVTVSGLDFVGLLE